MNHLFITLQADTQQAARAITEKASNNLEELRSLSTQDLLNRLAQSAVDFAINLAIAIVVFYVGRFVIRKLYGFVKHIFLSRQIDASLSTFILSLLNIVLYFILIITVIGILGIETTSFIALFASAGVAIGMALSGTLQNFAGGVLILLLKPYRAGDYIEVQGYAGTVKEIQIFFTIITTPDNKQILIPNGGLSTGSVNNYNKEPYRRISWTVSISYGDDVAIARQVILNLFEQDTRIMPMENESTPIIETVGEEPPATEPAAEQEIVSTSPTSKPAGWIKSIFGSHKNDETIGNNKKNQSESLHSQHNLSPAVYVNELAASSVDLQVRAWVKNADYWPVYFRFNELFYTELPKHGIHFPFPQLDVHLNSESC